MRDKFWEYLNNASDQEHPTRQTALTDNSYKNKDHSLDDRDINCRLATYGDALLKLAYCKILFDKGASKITVEKQKYESDKTLVEKIAHHYDLLKYIRFDEKIHKDYNYKEPSKPGKDSQSKYIATAVEALLAAIYLDNNENFDLVVDIAKTWKNLIDEIDEEKNKQQ